MSDESVLPQHLTSLGEALRPVCRKLEYRLDAPTGRVEVLSDPSALLDFLRFHLQQLEKAAHRLVDELNGALGDVASAEQAGEAEVEVSGASRRATEYRIITPYLAGRLWYDDDGNWVKTALEVHGETILYAAAE